MTTRSYEVSPSPCDTCLISDLVGHDADDTRYTRLESHRLVAKHAPAYTGKNGAVIADRVLVEDSLWENGIYAVMECIRARQSGNCEAPLPTVNVINE